MNERETTDWIYTNRFFDESRESPLLLASRPPFSGRYEVVSGVALPKADDRSHVNDGVVSHVSFRTPLV